MGKEMQASLKYLKDAGGYPHVVEHFNVWAKVRQDLWGFGDIICCFPSSTPGDKSTLHHRIIVYQVTSASNFSARWNKITRMRTAIMADRFLSAGGRIIVHAWGKKKEDGNKTELTLREKEVLLEDIVIPSEEDIQKEMAQYTTVVTRGEGSRVIKARAKPKV